MKLDSSNEEAPKQLFKSVERNSAVEKIKLMASLHKFPVRMEDNVAAIKRLVDKRNFLIHYKARKIITAWKVLIGRLMM